MSESGVTTVAATKSVTRTVACVGAALIAGGMVLSLVRFGSAPATLAQWNAGCSHIPGETAPAVIVQFLHYCRPYEFGYHALQWLIGVGAALLIGAIVIHFWVRKPSPGAVSPPQPHWQPPSA
jgi:hypothetical protein